MKKKRKQKEIKFTYKLATDIPKEERERLLSEAYAIIFNKVVENWDNKNMKTILIDAVYCFVIEKDGRFEIFEEMQKLLDSFSNRKIILTGANDEQSKKFELDDMPYEVFTLKHNPEKADPVYYEKMLQHFALDKDDVIYFEHDENAVKSAQSVGIKTYHYDNDKKDLTALKKFLIENFK
jgi:FMN phosphatase YigB (HAD superfamily)